MSLKPVFPSFSDSTSLNHSLRKN